MVCPICKKAASLAEDKIREGKGKVFHCNRCDLGILGKRIKNVKKYYESQYRKKYSFDIKTPASDPLGLFEVYKYFQDDRLKIIGPYLGKQKRLLEIGCSAGQFLYYVKKKVKESQGIELDSACARFVRRRLSIEVYENEIDTYSHPRKYFDLICSFQVLEHIIDPVGFLKRVRYFLKDRGLVFIEVPNLHDSLLAAWQVEGYRRFYFREAHNYYFSLKSLRKIARLAGLTMKKAYFIQDYSLVNHFHWYFKDQPQTSCREGLAKPRFAFNKKHNKFQSEFNMLIQKADQEYKDLLAKHNIASNIFLILSKSRH
ncbi:class I SAM-dependent methyltransferase [Candidatus Omnitrophota bacterium]